MLRIIGFTLISVVIFAGADNCKPSITTASGPSAPQKICSGQLIYHEPFDTVDKSKWAPLNTFSDNGVNSPFLSFVFNPDKKEELFFSYRTMNSNGMCRTMKTATEKMENCTLHQV